MNATKSAGRWQLNNTHAEQLSEIQDRYRDKRTLGWRMLDDVLTLLDSALIEERAKAEGIEVGVAKTVEELTRQRDIFQTRVKQLEAQLNEKRALREERDQTGEEVKVSIGRSQGGWKVGDLEEIAYRFRSGGAVDDTPVKITDWTMAATVPAPNLVPLVRPNGDSYAQHRQVEIPDRPAPLSDPLARGELRRWLEPTGLAIAGVTTLTVLGVLAILRVLLGWLV